MTHNSEALKLALNIGVAMSNLQWTIRALLRLGNEGDLRPWARPIILLVGTGLNGDRHRIVSQRFLSRTPLGLQTSLQGVIANQIDSLRCTMLSSRS